ncbi:isoprenylcysteine carboxylmethyltransferase family protein [Candidatus Kaiserbacteria bacterium]|nr:isoprenylcysteine carboxylmethyltransferase family protein [Candidatus Kaiserbacteria bacterium]
MNKTTLTSDSPQVIAPPPFIYLGGLAAGIALHWLKPLPFLPKSLTLPLGVAIIAVSVVLVVLAFRAFIRAKTNIDVRKPTTSVVSTGPYRLTRNPIYLSMTFLVLGIAVWANSLWILVTLVPVLLIMQFGVIVREESYLTKKFGDEYLRYKSKVRRWV